MKLDMVKENPKKYYRIGEEDILMPEYKHKEQK